MTPSQQEANAFVSAIRTGQSAVVVSFVETYPDAADTEDEYGWTALGTAARGGRVDFAALLLDHGADVNKKDRTGVAPMTHALQLGYFGMVKLLLERGAETYEEHNDGVSAVPTPLKLARQHGHVKIVALLEQWPQMKKEQEEQRQRENEVRALAEEISAFSPALKRSIPASRRLRPLRGGWQQ